MNAAMKRTVETIEDFKLRIAAIVRAVTVKSTSQVHGVQIRCWCARSERSERRCNPQRGRRS